MNKKWEEAFESSEELYLMIGNGFDLESGLPTSYRDYLCFVQAIEMIKEGETLEDFNINESIKKRLLCENIDFAFWDDVINSFWYKHFKKSTIRNLWIDFESEIAKVIRFLETSMDNTRFHQATIDDYVSGNKISDLSNTFYDLLISYGIQNKYKVSEDNEYIEYNVTYMEFRNKLLLDLNSFISGLEKYLIDFVEPLPIKKTDNIIDLIEKIRKKDKCFILSFNYTKTLENILKSESIDAEFCYVHGKISKNHFRNNMVLGMDEYLKPEAVKRMIGFAQFRKYNQRIFKETDSNYIDWLDNIKTYTECNRILCIMGHSLGISDKDIIGPFVTAKNMKTILYYHNIDALNNQVANLTAIIGMDEMISRTGGKKHTIEFHKQVYDK